jgi:hypothetical protein
MRSAGFLFEWIIAQITCRSAGGGHQCRRSTLESDMTTSKKQSRQAGKDLRDPKTPKKDRGPIASALAQSKHKPKKRK